MMSPQLICAGVGLKPNLSAGIWSAAAIRFFPSVRAYSRKASATGEADAAGIACCVVVVVVVLVVLVVPWARAKVGRAATRAVAAKSRVRMGYGPDGKRPPSWRARVRLSSPARSAD